MSGKFSQRMQTAGLGALLLASLVLGGCGGGVESRVALGNEEGVLHLGNGTEPQGLDPHIVTGLPEHHIIQAIFEGLVTKNPDTLEIEPGVAESWEISEDGRTYTFHLRRDARWTNGDPVTAEDFLWSWERALTPALGNQYNYMYYAIENARAFAEGDIHDFGEVGAQMLDPYTLRVTLNEPTPYFLQILDHYSTYPVHRETVLAFGAPTNRLAQWARAGNLVSNGAFELTEWRINSHVRVEKTETYWDADSVSLNAIMFYPTENLITEERMFRDGQLHYTNDVPLDKLPVYRRQQPDLLQIAPYLGSYYYMVNTTREPFTDPRVREALALAVNRELLIRSVMEGIGFPSYALTPPDTLGYYPPETFGYNPEEARRLLAEAGYPNGEDFPEFDILYNTHESHRKIAVAIQQMWREVLNIRVNLMNQEWKVYLDSTDTMNYDVARRGWIGDYVDPNSFLDMFVTEGGNNMTGFSNERYDEIIIEQAPTVLDRDERYELYQEAETILMESMPIIPIYIYESKHLKHPSLKGMPPNILDYRNYKYIRLDPVAEEEAEEALKSMDITAG